MKVLKKIVDIIRRPRIWGAAIVGALLIAAVAGTAVFITREGLPTKYAAIAYVLSAASAILLGYFIYCAVYVAPQVKAAVKQWASKREFTKKLVGQYGFRTIVFAAIAFVISVGNTLLNASLGIIGKSLWYLTLGLYYLLLSVMRGGVLLYHRSKRKRTDESERLIKTREIRTYMACGGWLIILPIVLSAVLWEIVGSNRAFVHSGFMIYVSALYTFYKIVSSVRNLPKAHKTDKMSVRAVRKINLADALVSVLALQTAMFHEFSPKSNLGIANAATGAVVCVITAILGITMLVIGGKQLKALKAGTFVNPEINEFATGTYENIETDEAAANPSENAELNEAMASEDGDAANG